MTAGVGVAAKKIYVGTSKWYGVTQLRKMQKKDERSRGSGKKPIKVLRNEPVLHKLENIKK